MLALVESVCNRSAGNVTFTTNFNMTPVNSFEEGRFEKKDQSIKIKQSSNQSTVLKNFIFLHTHQHITESNFKKRIYRKEKRLSSSSSSSRGYERVYTQLLYFPKRERDRPTGVLFRALLLRKE